jgi:glycerophosphoryl diester phosphodiesterase
MPAFFDLQGHRGARGLKPENTLPGFEVALDIGVSSIETDLHLTRDGVPVLFHDPVVSDRLCRLRPGSHSPDPGMRPLVSGLTLEELRGYCADRNPDRNRFPNQDSVVTPVARLFAEAKGFDPYTPPTLMDLFDFVQAYAGEMGWRAGKTPRQQQSARQIRFDLELKRVPFRPQNIGDDFDGVSPGLLERQVAQACRAGAMLERVTVRSFDHRSVWAIHQLEPALATGILIPDMAPASPVELVRQAGATSYFPEFKFLDENLLRALKAAGIRVVPWTVNDAEDWKRLLDWAVDGITTDYPDRLAVFLRERGVVFEGAR